MHFRQFYLGCLAHASYFIGARGEAVVVDPQRDVEQYLDEAERTGMRIRYVVETHLHADFVSGHAELAARTGAEIVIGAAAQAEFPHRAVRDGDEIRVGDVVLRAIETPGHTPESVCWLVSAEGEVPKLLTGDTLFIGDVGRPDLAGGRGFSSEQMASMLYDSLYTKILPLDDTVEVWPAHGAGSACGRNISTERCSTIGVQRKLNYALQPMPREEFVAMMTADLPPAPRYFPIAAELNRRGPGALDLDVRVLTPEEVVRSGALILDVRDSASFGAGHIAGAVHIGLEGQYASWAGTLLDAGQPVAIVAASAEKAREAVMRLARVGMENVAGMVDLSRWPEPLVPLPQVPVATLHDHLGEFDVLDVRRPAEWATRHVPGAVNVPLADLTASIERVPRGRPLAVICQSGYRSSIASSLLRRHGFTDVANVPGGTQAWVAAGLATD